MARGAETLRSISSMCLPAIRPGKRSRLAQDASRRSETSKASANLRGFFMRKQSSSATESAQRGLDVESDDYNEPEESLER